MLLAACFTGCGAHGASSGAAESPTTSTPNARPESAHHIEVAIVRSIDVGPGDLPREFGSKNTFGSRGNGVYGYVTMDMCGASFFSEILRTARHQVGYAAPNKDFVSTETVSYRDGGAAKAMSELRHAIRTCPTGYVHSTVAGVPPTKMRIERLPHQARWLPDTVAIAVTYSVRQRPSEYGVLIYQRQGNLITAAYVYAGRLASPRLASHVASLLAKRLKSVADKAGSTS